MIKVSVLASRNYDILIEKGILCHAASHIEKALGGRPRLCIITDDIVDSLHSKALEKALSGFETEKFVFKNGEGSKNINTYSAIIEFLAEKGFRRSDAIIAFGGGVCGDMAGFAAATYLRGIRFIQIPSTLLAMVDSSVGGKTAIDLNAGKNLCGAFWQPSLVLCDPLLLSTLPAEIFADGMAEVIKYGVISDSALFERLCEGNIEKDIESIIRRCVSIKRDIVSEDERESGIRALLNFGHTGAHAIEKLSGYEITHGRAVGMGMVIAARGAAAMGLCDADITDRLICALKTHSLDYSTPFDASEITPIALSDKKCSESAVTLILPERIGKCILYELSQSNLQSFFEKGIGK